MKKTRLSLVFGLAAIVGAPVWAQPSMQRETKRSSAPTQSASRAPSESAADAKAAFLALTESDRKALQEALGWLGFYNGVVDGAYGKRTIDALSAYQQNIGAVADGIANGKQVDALKNAAEAIKAAVGFKLIEDPSTGVEIGAPTKWLEKREGGAGFTSFTSKDGQIRLDLKETSGKLAALFKFLTAEAPDHKFTYKTMKPDAFFVIAGEDGDKKFYRRYAAPPADAADPDKLRGFMFVYPKSRAKALDPVALAIANSFQPFPAPPPPPLPVASATPTPVATPEAPRLAATALVVAPGIAVTTLPQAQCKAPVIEGKSARFLEDAGGLTQLGGDFGAGAVSPPIGQGGDDLIALSLVQGGDATEATLQVASAAALSAGGGLKIVAAISPHAIGAPIFDRQGRLVAFVAPFEAAEPRAGVVLAEPHATVPATSVRGGAPPTGETPLSASQIAARMRGLVVGLFCGA